jgi:hypothetical protein
MKYAIAILMVLGSTINATALEITQGEAVTYALGSPTNHFPHPFGFPFTFGYLDFNIGNDDPLSAGEKINVSSLLVDYFVFDDTFTGPASYEDIKRLDPSWFQGSTFTVTMLNGSADFLPHQADWEGGLPDDFVFETQNFTVLSDISPVPAPATLPLFVTGLGVIALLARHRRRKAAALFGASA